MARGSRPSTNAQVALRAPSRRLGTDQARRELNRLVKMFRDQLAASETLLDNAIEIGPHRSGGAWLVPEIDARAALARQEQLEQRIEELEETIEDLTVALQVAGREHAEPAQFITFDELARELGHADLASGG
jgi:hypothetical protein